MCKNVETVFLIRNYAVEPNSRDKKMIDERCRDVLEE